MISLCEYIKHSDNIQITYKEYLSFFEDTLLYESVKRKDGVLKGLDYLGFGRYGKDGVVMYVSRDGKLEKVEGDEDATDRTKEEKASMKSISKKLNNHIDEITETLKVSKDEVIHAFKQKKTFNFLKSVGWSIEKAAEAASKGFKTFNVALKGTFEELGKTGTFKKLQKGAMKVDEVMDKHPVLKKVGGVAVAGFLIYQWNNMAFSGDFDDDFDVTKIGEALTGNYNIADVFASPSGLKGLAQLAVGVGVGATFPWAKIGPATLKTAMLYTGAKQAGNSALAKKAFSALKAAINTK